MSVAPRLRRLVLFKHGVAHVERAGPADGPFELRVRRSEVNDVLKSLTAVVLDGDARVGAVTFDPADDPAEELEARRLLAPPGEALGTLLAAVRGRRVLADDGAAREGEVLGVEASPREHGAIRRQLVLRQADGSIALVDLEALRRLELLDPSSRADVDLLVDKSRAMTAGDARLVRVDVVGRADDLRVAYIVPAPTWRVSYRVALDEDEDRALVAAWAIVHNPADEDVEDVELVLTTGQPVSFEIDLARPKRLARAVVEEQSRVASAPRRIEAMTMAAPPPAPPAMPAMASSSRQSAGAPPPPPGARHLADALEQQAVGAAHLDERGELFEYRVAHPVSLRRGGSAMVPIASARVAVRKDRIWREGAPPPPDLVLAFTNTTGAVLEEGPAVVYASGGYAGEAMSPYAARNAEVRFAYAKDLAVRCSSRRTSRDRTIGVRLLDDVIAEDRLREHVHAIRVESDHDRPVRVLVEVPIVAGRRLASGTPVETTATAHRFALEAAPHGVAELEVVEAQPVGQQIAWGNLAVHQLAAWLDGKLLDREIVERLRWIIEREEDARRHEQRREIHARRRAEKHEEIGRLAQQLGVLAQQGPEGHLRVRYAEQMEAAQAAVRAAEEEMRRLEARAEEARSEGRAALARLVAERRPAP